MYTFTAEGKARHTTARARQVMGPRPDRVEAARAMGRLNRGRPGNRSPLKAEVGYGGIHRRADKVLSRKCSDCGKEEGRLEVSLIHGRGTHIAEGKPFSQQVEDYVRRCVPCHRTYDQKERSSHS